MLRLFLSLVLWICVFVVNYSQISPPGLGKANIAVWTAIGFRQSLHPIKKIQLMTYIGYGRISDPDNYNPLQKPAIFVLNQEFYHQFHSHWQYSVAISYRRQNEYENVSGLNQNPITKQEIRLYTRFSYILEKGRFKMVITGRPEFRKFFTTDFRNWEETIQLRGRLRAQFSVSVNQKKSNKFIVSGESLFAASNMNESTNYWTPFSYKESRFCLYYSFAPPKLPLVFNWGYMNNLIGSYPNISDVHYFCFDIIWENPFGNPRHKKILPVENLE